MPAPWLHQQHQPKQKKSRAYTLKMSSQRTNSVGNWTEMILLQANSVSLNVFPALRIHHWENCWTSSVPSSGICQKRKTPQAGILTSQRRLTSTRIRAVHWKQMCTEICNWVDTTSFLSAVHFVNRGKPEPLTVLFGLRALQHQLEKSGCKEAGWLELRRTI